MVRRLPRSIVRIAAAIVITITSASAQADLQFSCPLRWDMVGKLAGPNLDADFYGKAVREWTRADLDQMIAWEYRCDAGTMPPTMRQVQLANVQRWYNNGIQALAQKDQQLAAGRQREAVANEVQQRGLTQVSVQGGPSGEATITLQYLPDARPDYDSTHNNTRTCRTLADNPLGAVTPQTLQQASGFADACVQGQRMDAATFARFQQRVKDQTQLYANMDGFTRQVEKLASVAASQQGESAQLQEQARQLMAEQAQMAQAANKLGVIDFPDEPVPGAKWAEETLKTTWDSIQRRGCDAAYANTGMPAKWRSALYLTDASQPDKLADLVCLAVQRRVGVHYLSKGLIGDEGFELVTRKLDLKIYPEIEHNDNQQVMLVPSKVTLNGKSFDIDDRKAIHQLAAVILMMLQGDH